MLHAHDLAGERVNFDFFDSRLPCHREVERPHQQAVLPLELERLDHTAGNTPEREGPGGILGDFGLGQKLCRYFPLVVPAGGLLGREATTVTKDSRATAVNAMDVMLRSFMRSPEGYSADPGSPRAASGRRTR